MSQQALSRILKPLVYKTVLRNYNMAPSCSSTPYYYPYLLIDHLLKVGDSSDGRVERGDESEGEKNVVINDDKLVEEVRNAMNDEFIIRRGHDFHIVGKNNIYNDEEQVRLYNSYLKKSQIPPLPKGSQIQNVAMSFRPDLNNVEDLVVAVKFSGSQLRVCRYNDTRWIDIETTHESISPYSNLMYSKKDERFYVPTPSCNYLCSFDLNFKENDKPEFVEVRKKDVPKYDLFELIMWSKFTKTDHMVESPSGEQFLISRYYEDETDIYKGSLRVNSITRQFMVFREDEQLTDKKTKYMSYTEDIGDLCIFLGRDEAFCVRASSSPGLKANCIYFVGHSYGVYDITTQTCTLFLGKDLSSNEFPYWPHPLSLTPYKY